MTSFRLGDWLVQPDQCRISTTDWTVQVRAKVMDLLTYLAARPGEMVSKERLLDDLWGSQAVSESALTRTVTELRQALGDSADAPHLLETIPKRGYRLIGSVVLSAPAAERAHRQAVSLNSGYALAHLALANVISHSGRHSAATEEMRRALEIDRLDPMMHAISSQLAFHADDYPAAAEYARQALLIDPAFWVGHMQLGQVRAQMGQTDLALQSLAEAERLSGGNSKPLSTKGYVFGKAGRTDEARAVLEQLMARSRQRYVPEYAVALVHAGLDDTESPFAALDLGVYRARRAPRLPDSRSEVGWLPERAQVQAAARTVRVRERPRSSTSRITH